MFKKWNRSIFVKYLISHLVLFFIPIVLIGGITLYYSVGKLRQEILTNYNEQLEQVAKDLDQQFSQLEKTAFIISSDNAFLPYYLFSDSYYEVEAIKQLKKYRDQLLFSESVALYFGDKDDIYTSEGKYQNKVFFTSSYPLKNWEPLLQEAQKSKTPFFRWLPDLHTLIYVYPISTNNSIRPNASVIYFIKDKEVRLRLHSLLGSFEGDLYIYGPERQPILSVAKDDSLDPSVVKTFLDGSSSYIPLKNEKFNVHMFKYSQPDSKFTYVMVMPSYGLLSKAEQLRNTMLFIFSLSVLAGLVLAWAFAYRNYFPIKQMQGYVRNSLPDDGRSGKRNELDRIRMALDSMMVNNNTLQERVLEQQHMIRQNVLTAVLQGVFEERHEGHLQAARIHLDGPFYAVMILQDQDSSSTNLSNFKEKIFELFEERFTLRLEAYAIDIVNEKQLAVIVNLPSNEIQWIEACINDVLESSHYHGFQVKIGISSITENLSGIKFAFLEALSAAEHETKSSLKRIVHFRDIAHQETGTVWYPTDILLRLQQSVKQGNSELAIGLLNQVSCATKERKLLWYAEKLVAYELINAIIKIHGDIHLSLSDQELKRMVSFINMEDLLKVLDLLLLKACREVSENHTRKSDKMMREVLSYLESNFNEYTMSLEMMADHFHISSFSLSKIFKEYTGLGFKEYLIKRRMEEAKRMLRDSSENVSWITKHIGYTNVSHFIKTFKKLEGLTPNEYRQIQDFK